MGLSLRIALAMTLAAVLLVAGVALPAHAADELSVSSDGRTWSGQLDRPLFAPGVRWSPGDRRTAYFWVRNDADEVGRLSVGIRTPGQSSGFDDLVVRASGGSVTWTEDSAADDVRTADLGPGRVERIAVEVSLPASSRNVSQLDSVDLELVVRLDGGSAPGPAGPGDGPDGGLPDTGGQGVWLFGLAVVLLGGGLLLITRTRREKEKES